MKILLIEDRTKRQELFTNNTKIDLQIYEDILDNLIDEKYREFRDQILKDASILDKYDIIISHKSAFEENNSKTLTVLENHCKVNNKPLVYFSGGIVSNYYQNDEYEKLILNSKTFYSQNLKIFLDNIKKEQQNIMMLCYGERWELNIVLNTLEKLNSFIEDNRNKELVRSNRVPTTSLVKIIDLLQENKVTIKEVITYRDCLYSYIKELVND